MPNHLQRNSLNNPGLVHAVRGGPSALQAPCSPTETPSRCRVKACSEGASFSAASACAPLNSSKDAGGAPARCESPFPQAAAVCRAPQVCQPSLALAPGLPPPADPPVPGIPDLPCYGQNGYITPCRLGGPGAGKVATQPLPSWGTACGPNGVMGLSKVCAWEHDSKCYCMHLDISDTFILCCSPQDQMFEFHDGILWVSTDVKKFHFNEPVCVLVLRLQKNWHSEIPLQNNCPSTRCTATSWKQVSKWCSGSNTGMAGLRRKLAFVV